MKCQARPSDIKRSLNEMSNNSKGFLKASLYASLLISAQALATEYTFHDPCESDFTINYPDRYIINVEQNTVIDRVTELMWDRCFYGMAGAGCDSHLDNPDEKLDKEISYRDQFGQDYNQQVNNVLQANNDLHRGYDDWRMPNVKELMALSDSGCITYVDDSVGNYETFMQSHQIFPMAELKDFQFKYDLPSLISSTPASPSAFKDRLAVSWGSEGQFRAPGTVIIMDADEPFLLRLVRGVKREEFNPSLTSKVIIEAGEGDE